MQSEYQKTADEHANPEVDYEAQRAARDAIMAIPLFPELTVALRKALGYGPHVDMLQHFCYWFHPRKPKMQKRWQLWKTFDEWLDECGLTDRQVKKGRKVLADKGIVTYKRGQYSRVYYRPDWVALAEALGIKSIPDANTVPYDDFDDFENSDIDDSIPDGISARLHSGRYSDQVIPDGISVRLNTEDFAGDYLTGESTLQVGGEPAFAEPPPHEMNKEKEQKHLEAQPIKDNVSSQNGHAPSKTATREAVDIEPLVEITPPRPDDDTLLAEVRELLDPDSGKWWGAAYVVHSLENYKPENVAKYIADEENLPYNGRASELEPVARYVLWEMEQSRGAA